MKVDTEAKLQGLPLLPKEIYIFVIVKLKNIEFFVRLKTLLTVNCKMGQSSTSRATPCCIGPPGHTTPKKSVAGAGRSSF